MTAVVIWSAKRYLGIQFVDFEGIVLKSNVNSTSKPNVIKTKTNEFGGQVKRKLFLLYMAHSFLAVIIHKEKSTVSDGGL